MRLHKKPSEPTGASELVHVDPGPPEEAEGWRQRFGFRFGPVSIQRLVSDPKWGVLLAIVTERETIDFRVTPKGFIRMGVSRKPNKHELWEWAKR